VVNSPRNAESSRRALPTVAVLVAAATAAVPLIRLGHQRQLTWGATPQEVAGMLPGDELGPADLVATRAIDIDAPPSAVWPWLVQMGQGRGGFYSYDALENLVGLGIHSAERIEPQWQGLAVGDPVHLADEVTLTAVTVEPDHALVLQGDVPVDDDDPAPATFVWAFVVEPRGDSGSRLLVRERYSYELGWARRMVPPITWLSFVMTERMMRGIRERAERR